MRLSLCFVVCVLLLEITMVNCGPTTTITTGMPLKTCFKQTDCSKSECCETRRPPPHRPGFFPVRPYPPGLCKPRLQSGEICIPSIFSLKPGISTTWSSCPCRAGLRCKRIGWWRRGKCVTKRPSTSGKCNTAADCGMSQCCVSNVRPKGKRYATPYTGTCKPLGRTGSRCLVRNDTPLPKPGAVFESCPCLGRLTCVGNGLFDIPLGEMGTCKRRRK